jgi:uncharacterized protein
MVAFYKQQTLKRTTSFQPYMAFDIIIGRNKEDKKRFGENGLIRLGKGYVQMGNYTSLSNNILVDTARSHVILIAGKRGSGKSYSIGVIAEELSDLPPEVKENIAPLIFDTMGIFWTMKYKNDKESALLQEWDEKARQLPVTTWAPTGYKKEFEEMGIPIDKTFAVSVEELDIGDWLTLFELSIIDPIAIVIQKTIATLKETNEYDIDDILLYLKQSTEHDENISKAACALFEAAQSWKIFAHKNEKATNITDLIHAGKTTVLDISMYSSSETFNVRALIVGLVSKKLFTQRMLERKREEIESIRRGVSLDAKKKHMPLVWLFLDEAHEFLPKNGKTPATGALLQVLREGRQPGISIVLATQQPGVIHRDVMTQSDIVIAHKLTNKHDIAALNEIMQTYVLEGITKAMNQLPDVKGSALILDDNSERLYPVRVRPRFTWHGGEAPTAVLKSKL